MKQSQIYLRFLTALAPSLVPLLTAAVLVRLFTESSSGTYLALNQAATTVGVLQFGLQISFTKILRKAKTVDDAAPELHGLCHRAVLVAVAAYVAVCTPLLLIYQSSGTWQAAAVAVMCYLPTVALSPATMLHQSLFLEFNREASNLKAILSGVAAVLAVQIGLLFAFGGNPAACATAAVSIVAVAGFFIRRRSLKESTPHVFHWKELPGTILTSKLSSYGDTVTAAKNAVDLYVVSSFFMLLIYAAALGGPQMAHWVGASVMIMRSVIKPLRQAGVVMGRQLGTAGTPAMKLPTMLATFAVISLGMVLGYAFLLELSPVMMILVATQALVEVAASTLFTVCKVVGQNPMWGTGVVLGGFCLVAAVCAVALYGLGRFTAPNVWSGILAGRCVVAAYTLVTFVQSGKNQHGT